MHIKMIKLFDDIYRIKDLKMDIRLYASISVELVRI